MGIINLDPTIQIILIPIIIFALSFHEYAHGWMAYRLGDPTAHDHGRLTLNPLAHLDIFGTMVLYFVGFGWAKPVPVDPGYLSNPKKDMLRIALAGPVSNLILALASGLLLRLFFTVGLVSNSHPITTVLVMSLQINLILAIFNFLPIPPLDGSRILSGLLPYRYNTFIVKFEYYGPRVLIGIFLLGMVIRVNFFGMIISPIIYPLVRLFTLSF